MNIYKVNATSFHLLIKDLQNQVFFITIAEIEKLQAQEAVKDSFSLEVTFLSKMSLVNTAELMIKLPSEYHDFANVFDKQAVKVLPLRHFYNHKIELESLNSLLKSWLYVMFRKKLQKVKEYLFENLDKGFIILSKAPFAFLILFVIKSDDSLRFCIDYWRLNTLTH